MECIILVTLILIFNLKIIWLHLHEKEVRIIIKKVEVYNQFNINQFITIFPNLLRFHSKDKHIIVHMIWWWKFKCMMIQGHYEAFEHECHNDCECNTFCPLGYIK
jgi:hypothetical protein